MKKLRLEVEDLRVESFDVREDVPDARGTVRAEQQSFRDHTCEYTEYDRCPPSYQLPCWWTGDPLQDCYPPSELNPCTDYPAYC